MTNCFQFCFTFAFKLNLRRYTKDVIIAECGEL